MSKATIAVSYSTVNGETGDLDYPVVDLMENILPDMRPPISTIVFSAAGLDGKQYFVSISPGGVTVHLPLP